MLPVRCSITTPGSSCFLMNSMILTRSLKANSPEAQFKRRSVPLLAFIRKGADEAQAAFQSFPFRIAPARRQQRSDTLIYLFIRFGKKAQPLTGGRHRIFLNGDPKAHSSLGLALLHRKRREFSQFLSGT